MQEKLLAYTPVGIMYSTYAILMAFLPLLFSVILDNYSNQKSNINTIS